MSGAYFCNAAMRLWLKYVITAIKKTNDFSMVGLIFAAGTWLSKYIISAIIWISYTTGRDYIIHC